MTIRNTSTWTRRPKLMQASQWDWIEVYDWMQAQIKKERAEAAAKKKTKPGP